MSRQATRQSIRKAVILIMFLLFPIVLNYLSPYLIIDSASQGIVNGSLVVFALLFVSSLVFGRLWCAWVCPGAGLQEASFMVNNAPARGGKVNWIKWGIWIPWIATIAAMAILAGGYHSVNLLYSTESGISIDAPDILPRYITYYLVMGLVLVLAFTSGRRAFCHYACWMAPFMILGRKLRNVLRSPALHLRADKTLCARCESCTKTCPMSLDVAHMVQTGQMEHSECILCATCIDGCPKGVIRYALGRPPR
jgi:ferredoxin-type protein NapH